MDTISHGGGSEEKEEGIRPHWDYTTLTHSTKRKAFGRLVGPPDERGAGDRSDSGLSAVQSRAGDA